MGLGAISLLLALGFVVLGPKQMHAMLGRLARAKAELDRASRGLKSQLTAELEGSRRGADDETKKDVEAAPAEAKS